MTAGRILVQASAHDGLVERLAAKASQLPVGHPTTGQVTLGPPIGRSPLERVQQGHNG